MVSVIIPAYNASKFIAKAITSVLSQTYSLDIEIIVIDDGSSDDTKSIVYEMSLCNKQIILLSNAQNKGPSGARNMGMLSAQGKYVAFLDADDIWLSNHLDEGIKFLEKNSNVDVIFFNFAIYEYDNKQRISDWFTERSFTKSLNFQDIGDKYCVIFDDMLNALLDESFIHLPSMIVRRTTLKGIFFNEKIKYGEDRDFAIKLYNDSKAKFAYKNIITGIYFRHKNSLTFVSFKNELHRSLDRIELLTGYLSTHSQDIYIVSKLNKTIFKSHLSASYNYRKLNNHKLSLVYLFKSLKYKVSFSQLSELLKIIASSLISNLLRKRV